MDGLFRCGAALAVSAVLVSGCTDSGLSPDQPDPGSSAADERDSSGADTSADAGDESNTGGDTDDVDWLQTECGPVVELGELSLDDEPLEVQVDFAPFDGDAPATACSETEDGMVAVHEFSTPAFHTGALKVDTGGQADVEVRRGGCDPEAEAVSFGCYPSGFDGIVDVGTTHHLLVEPRNPALEQVEMTIRYDSVPECQEVQPDSSPGDTSCAGADTVQVCDVLTASPDVARFYESDCPDSCVGDHCRGDGCDNPIRVSAAAPFDWSGANRAFVSHYDQIEEVHAAEDRGDAPSCVLDDGETGLHTPGREMVFELEDVRAGDRVSVVADADAQLQDNLAVVLKRDCAAEAECVDIGLGDEHIEFEIPETSDGTGDSSSWYLFVDTRWEALDGWFETLSVHVE